MANNVYCLPLHFPLFAIQHTSPCMSLNALLSVPSPVSGASVAVSSVEQEQLCDVSLAIAGGFVDGRPSRIVLYVDWSILHKEQVAHHVLLRVGQPNNNQDKVSFNRARQVTT